MLKGKVALVTGGAGDLGRAMGRALAEAGATVVLGDVDSQLAREAAEGLVAQGLNASHAEIDVADEASVTAAIASLLDDRGALDILINNAGIAARRASVELAFADWARVLAVNLGGTFLCSRTAARHMLERRSGAIVNVASIMGLLGNQLYANPAYHASKGGIVNLTRAHAAEWASHGIRVNAVAPTFVDTRLTGRLLEDASIRDGILSRTPMGRLADADDVAAAVVFLASDAAKFITGAIVPVDGGWTAT